MEARVNWSEHAAKQAQRRGIPPLIDEWLDSYGEEVYDGHGATVRYFSKRSIREMEKAYGSLPVRKLSEWHDAYKVVSIDDGTVITIGHRRRRLWRR
jgi:hypothetical protein